MKVQQPITVWVKLSIDKDAGAEKMDELTRRLNEEIARLNVDAVEFPRAGSVPRGTKGSGRQRPGQLRVTLGRETLNALVGLLKSWSARNLQAPLRLQVKDGTDKLEFNLDPASALPEELRRFIEQPTRPGTSL